jgi:hypothetical protein
MQAPRAPRPTITMKRLEVAGVNSASLSVNEERRSAVRHRVCFPLPCWPADGGPVWKAYIRDISTLGIAINLPQEVTMGTVLEIELQSVSASPIRRVMARVVHVEQEERGWWAAGCAFIEELTAHELNLVHAEAIRSKATDQRRWLRFPCNVETVCYTCETAPGERRPARVVNISAGGIGLLLACQFEQGTLLQFELPADLNQPARLSLVRVVRVLEQSPGTWFHGCEFAVQLAEDDLRRLLQQAHP